MKVYYYCSYTRSPVGFRLGMVDTDNTQGETCELASEGIQPLIRRCFSQGSIRRAHGLIPQGSGETGQYFMLIKSKEPIKEGEMEYFINFALVTNQREEYERWFQDKPQEENVLLQAVRDTIVLNRSSEFGFAVRVSGLRALKEITYGLPEAVPASADGVCVEAILPRGGAAQLLDILGLTEYDVQKRGNWLFMKKKQQRQSPWVIAAIVAAAVAIFLLILNSQ